ncbi:hypothetical protein PR003_g28553 [Phytophthora rubi]|uniref:Uncharacterized protein n=1 Tax=Phytophthora rubi TaxID=129364 RepID=A0A6A4BQU9_9STRA|nr:hypothetical protein PR001_g27377 [Phytophthora rubi]KAE9038673.1 hypothetical protein PR002_g5903 [Phytophthora rubi]KAE9278350.1 hypothetical protein PR003_g28553 [Phytophthora rubi]
MNAIRWLMELKEGCLQDNDSAKEEEDLQGENMASKKRGVGEVDIPSRNKTQRTV